MIFGRRVFALSGGSAGVGERNSRTSRMGEQGMGKTVFYIVLCYLSGSVLYANVFGGLFGVRKRYAESADRNPGVTNAYKYGGFWCGTLTLVCELAKGALPVFCARFVPGLRDWAMPVIIAAPVVGHVLPVFYDFRGGKGIAVTFGCLLGLFPYTRPLAILAASFIFFSVVIKIYPHYYRTIAAFVFAGIAMLICPVRADVLASFLFDVALVCLRLVLGHEEKEKFEVKLLWMR